MFNYSAFRVFAFVPSPSSPSPPFFLFVTSHNVTGFLSCSYPHPRIVAMGARPPPDGACVNCGATETPLWRTGPAGPKTLCNACGVRWKKTGSVIAKGRRTGKHVRSAGRQPAKKHDIVRNPHHQLSSQNPGTAHRVAAAMVAVTASAPAAVTASSSSIIRVSAADGNPLNTFPTSGEVLCSPENAQLVSDHDKHHPELELDQTAVATTGESSPWKQPQEMQPIPQPQHRHHTRHSRAVQQQKQQQQQQQQRHREDSSTNGRSTSLNGNRDKNSTAGTSTVRFAAPVPHAAFARAPYESIFSGLMAVRPRAPAATGTSPRLIIPSPSPPPAAHSPAHNAVYVTELHAPSPSPSPPPFPRYSTKPFSLLLAAAEESKEQF